jgi:hypothetical protein
MRRSWLSLLPARPVRPGVALALALALASGAASLWPLPARAQGSAQPGGEVDLALVLAVDISYSMDIDELRLQRDGYVEAFRSQEIQKAITGGMIGRIAVAYVEWAGAHEQRTLVDWTLIDSGASAEAFAARVAAEPIRRAYRTSISEALNHALPMFEANPFRATRRVIDVSGDGPNNQGMLVTVARDRAVAAGIVINGLPVMLKRAGPGSIDDLDLYYEDCVIGGRGAFLVPVREASEFKKAIRTKLLFEISSAEPPPGFPVVPAQARAPRVSCTIGERMWRERFAPGYQ